MRIIILIIIFVFRRRAIGSLSIRKERERKKNYE